MQVIEQSWSWEQCPIDALKIIERAGRTCYKSEDKITDESAKQFVRHLAERGHHSVIEHASASVRFITDRGVSHELVRHRLASFSQESTRYCNYGQDHIQFIRPVWVDIEINTYENIPDWWRFEEARFVWLDQMLLAEAAYKELLQYQWRPEMARSVLPNSLKTELVMTCNLREWMHVFKLRTSKAAHPQMRALMLDCLKGFQEEVPILFDGIGDN